MKYTKNGMTPIHASDGRRRRPGAGPGRCSTDSTIAVLRTYNPILAGHSFLITILASLPCLTLANFTYA